MSSSLAAASPSATGPAASPAASACPTPGGEAIQLTIATTSGLSLAFTESVLTAPAATLVTVEYLNDSPVPHNIAFHEGSDASAPLLAATPVETGPDNLQTVTFTTPAEPGSYYFLCDVHPTLMEGTLEVT